MTFSDVFKTLDRSEIEETLYKKDTNDVKSAIAKTKLTYDDFLALISPAAEAHIDEMAKRANSIVKRRFGNVINLYAPLYVSNECTNSCVYCGFNVNNKIKRVSLTIDEALKEADILYNHGIRDILLVSGEAPKTVTIPYLKELTQRLHRKFASIALEIYPLSADDYRQIARAGCDGLTIYQESYDGELYEKVHLKGRKRDFFYRLETPDRGGAAGLRRLGIGILMGLSDWRTDCAFLAKHAAYLTKKYWRSKISVSFPRLRPAFGGFEPLCDVTDANLVQVITALRIYLNDIGIVLSTREKPALRDSLVPLGITQMSAGSKTTPGGYVTDTNSCEQFAVEDTRSPADVCRMLSRLGYDPVFKDWDAGFIR